jgi:uncharacterized protein (TIGR02145 family)
MAENLSVSTFQNGDAIKQATNAQEWENAGKKKQPIWCYYDYNPANGSKYGKIYNWYAINDARGLAPEGWKIPSDAEWMIMINYLGGVGNQYSENGAGQKLKNTSGWEQPNNQRYYNGTNESGFNALPGGFCYSWGSFSDMGQFAHFWTSTTEKNYTWETDKNHMVTRVLSSSSGEVSEGGGYKEAGHYVRCIKR